MNIEMVPVNKLQMAAYNPRKELHEGDQGYQSLKASMDEFGYVEPIIWNELTGNVVGGHQRLKVLIAQGIEEVEVSVVSLDQDKEKALNLALNKISGGWDFDKLSVLIEELVEKDFASLTGFTDKEIAKLIDQVDIEATISSVGEIDTGEFTADKFDHKCPRCGFLY